MPYSQAEKMKLIAMKTLFKNNQFLTMWEIANIPKLFKSSIENHLKIIPSSAGSNNSEELSAGYHYLNENNKSMIYFNGMLTCLELYTKRLGNHNPIHTFGVEVS